MPPQQDDTTNSQVRAAQSSLDLAFRVLGGIGLLTVGLILVAVLGGLWLDRTLGTKPLFLVLLLVGSFPISFYIIYRVAINAVSRVPPPPTKRSRMKEESLSDDDDRA